MAVGTGGLVTDIPPPILIPFMFNAICIFRYAVNVPDAVYVNTVCPGAAGGVDTVAPVADPG